MNEGIEINLRELFYLLLHRIWVIILSAVLVGTVALVYTMNFITPQYRASVTIYVNNNSSQESSSISSSDLSVAQRLVDTYVNIIQSDRVLEKVLDETNLALSASAVRNMLSAEAVNDTEMFQVTLSTPNPQMSADLANAIAEVAPQEIAEIIEGSSAKIIDYARVPQGRSSPSFTKNAILGAFVGAVLAVVAIIAYALLDVRIKNEDDLLAICSVPVLGVIPDITTVSKNKKTKGRR